ncbi:class I SAM-dependent methyltransferase [Propionicimonas sp. T2.31MG-18]|uniref:class I SAM-dependent methyltransferase n=1 Tax=Propionicimonas sp. T2.31MG-18 TaxID=3157620 RepID=UPI00366BC766
MPHHPRQQGPGDRLPGGHHRLLPGQEGGCSLTSVDLNKEMITWARQRSKREGLADRITFQVAEAQDLPFGNGIFDAVIAPNPAVPRRPRPMRGPAA